MFKAYVTIDLDSSIYKAIVEGTQLLNTKINTERFEAGKSVVNIREEYYLRMALAAYNESLKCEITKENFN